MDQGGLDDLAGRTVGVLGGTGPQGRGLAYRWALAGLEVVIGSRDASRAATIAGELNSMAGLSTVRGLANEDCASASDIVVVAVPWDGHRATIEPLRSTLAGKIVVDCVNPLGFDKQGPFAVAVPEGSAAAQAATLLPESTVVAAFHHVSAVLLGDRTIDKVDTDVLVLGDDRPAVNTVIALANAIPDIRGVYGGRLRNAAQVEALTANLIAINRRYSAHAGLRITDI
jgi:8-hydroxy-5-deazaflavin:NADPH oxidoreductase